MPNWPGLYQVISLPEYDSLVLSQSSGWLTVWFNSPESRNPLTVERSREIVDLCAWLRQTPQIRGVVFRGQGGVFCAGGDLKAFAAMSGEAEFAEIHKLSLEGADLFDAVDALPQYTVMAVEGAAVAGGFGLMCIGDHVIADITTRLSLSEVRIGLVPAQIAPFVVRRLGIQTARKLMLTGAHLDAGAARRVGLVDETVADAAMMEDALVRQRQLVNGAAPGALAAIKTLTGNLYGQSRSEQREAAANAFAEAMLSKEGREGVRSFVEKRKPDWAV